MKHNKDCELGINWESCPACVEAHNSTCKESEKRKKPTEDLETSRQKVTNDNN